MGTQSITVKAGAAAYIVHLAGAGNKPSTIGTVKRTLDLLVTAMGEDKEVGKILAVHVDGFYKSEAATMLKGKPRAQASILQIRRIVRAALVWWHEQGYSDKLALPAMSASSRRSTRTRRRRGSRRARARTPAPSPPMPRLPRRPPSPPPRRSRRWQPSIPSAAATASA